MSRHHKMQVLFLAAIVLALLLFLPIFLTEPRLIKDQTGGAFWRNIIFDFQTLITGVLAVLAAYLTVRSGMLIDERQQERHQQMMAFTMRRELQTLERAFNPQVNEFTKIVNGLWRTDYDFEAEEANNWKWFSEICDTYYWDMRELDAITNRDQFTDARLYFDGRLSNALTLFKESYGSLMPRVVEHRKMRRSDADFNDQYYYESEWGEIEAGIALTTINFARDAIKLRNELTRARGEYLGLLGRYKH